MILVTTQPWANDKSDAQTDLISRSNEKYTKWFSKFIFTCNQLLDGVHERIENLSNVPGLQSDVKLLSVLIQNSFHGKNSNRTGAITGETYKDIVKVSDAKKYLASLTRAYLLGRLRYLETNLLQQFASAATEAFAQNILKAPDQFYAASMIKDDCLKYGNGDFQAIVSLLCKNNAQNHGYRDVANKLNLVRHGYLFEKGVLQELEGENDPQQDYVKGQGKSLQLFADKNKEESSIKPKWIHQIFKNQDIPLSQMQKIFPEQASFKRLELYDKMYKNRDEDYIA